MRVIGTMERKKVLLCIPTLGTGGAEKFVVDLATQLDKSLFAVSVVVTRKMTSGGFYDMLQEKEIPVVDLSAGSVFGMFKKQMAFFKKERPDAIHTNIGALLHTMVAAKLAGIPTRLFTMHNQVDYSVGRSKQRKWLYKLAFSVLGFTPVAICENIAKSIHEGFGVPTKKIKTVNNGVNTHRFVPPQEQAKRETIEIINTGTMYVIKNHAMLIDVFARLYQKNPNLRLTILGHGELREQLDRQVQELGLTAVVRMPGIQMNVNDYLQQADIYVSASRTEGLPLSILEAMACGLPVVATAAGGTVDIVKTGINGTVVPIDDKEEMQKALQALISDAELRVNYGKASRETAEAWSIEACVSGYAALYTGKKK